MSKELLSGRWMYGFLLIPVISAILALVYHDFIFKAGVAGTGIILLVTFYVRKIKESKDIWAIVAAFVFSIAGDWFLSNRHGNTNMFIAGIALFFFAHIGYLLYALMNGSLNKIFTAILLTAYLIFFFCGLYPSIENQVLLVAVLIYTLISCFSLGAAAGIKAHPEVKWTYFFGIVMVLFSDTIIAFREFTEHDKLKFLILPTYYLAQISVVLSLIMKGYKCKEIVI
ncbi:MAG: lysoplasmalogenase [Mangrovibacterium sp.]